MEVYRITKSKEKIYFFEFVDNIKNIK